MYNLRCCIRITKFRSQISPDETPQRKNSRIKRSH